MPGGPCPVSVVIPVFNSAGTLRRAVVSVLGQTLRDLELLIVDDGSRDASLSLARRFADADDRIRVIALPHNRGKPHAMNVAIAEARGAWIAVLDADDWYAPDRLATMAAAGESHGVPLVADNQRFYDAAADSFVRTAFPPRTGDRELSRASFIAGSNPYEDFNFGMLKPIVHADFIRRTGLRYRESATLAEDFLYLVELFAAGGSGFLVAEPLYNWTQPFGSRSRQWTTTGQGSWRYDFRAALGANAEVLHDLRQRNQHDLAALLTFRARAYKRLQCLKELNQMRAAGVPLSRLMRMVALRPWIWPHIARRMFPVARRRYSEPDADLRISLPTSR
ncbi:MAG TPA: glycosyltransferase family 2 protein [Acetobacteraceae bacterium]